MAAHKLTSADLDALRRYARTTPSSLTPVMADGGTGGRIHPGFEEGTHDTVPVCGALRGRETITTDDSANCGGCATVVRAIGLGDHLRDEDGWTGLYQPRTR